MKEMAFERAVGKALAEIRGGGNPRDVIPTVVEGLDQGELLNGAKAGLYARVFQILDQERAPAEHQAIGEAGEKSECPQARCTAGVVRIERYQTTVMWEKSADGSWDCGAYDQGTHFHLFCSDGHETKAWPNRGNHSDYVMPVELLRVVYRDDG